MSKGKGRSPDVTCLYRDNRFQVTTADIRTPSMYYPIGDTVGRRRRDILFGALGYSAVMASALLLYLDLWRFHEWLLMAGSIAAALYVGFNFSILQLDARGFPPRLFVARAQTVKAIFEAITQARAQAHSGRGGFEPDDLDNE
ncbi:MAG: hypothetical protein QNI84_12175 [Henriciella sp.]|nr:hypothetical protein [Henriciella sp.]